MKPSSQRGLFMVGGLIAAILSSWVIVSVIRTPKDTMPPPAPPPPGAPRFPVVFTAGKGAPRVAVGTHPISGEPLTASCTTCHATRAPDVAHGAGNLPKTFHQGLAFNHDHLACLACHDAGNYDQLHLADASPVRFEDAMTLCSQCHSKQREAFDHGAHGGMNGYWDLSRGPRTRHACTDCHDPHAPKFPQMQPAFKAKDRFLDAPHDAPHPGASDERH